ncbi:hypothetical protein PENDEC_c005G01705 [Penicillium decumbens]|uniref:Myb-like domain-containing protein n=1 Tax=Penicillium decumbens TaxID=69771 RepID=A0A1V6PGG7_PENDC|nr:hypothetical protein PENDEC_c005G01705 [Penicillium decumbens]
MAIKWNNAADQKLIVALAATLTSQKSWEQVAELMGDGCSVSALKQHIASLRKKLNIDSKLGKASGSASKVTKARNKRTSKKQKEESDEDENVTTDGSEDGEDDESSFA